MLNLSNKGKSFSVASTKDKLKGYFAAFLQQITDTKLPPGKRYTCKIRRCYKSFLTPFPIFSTPIIYNFTSGTDLMDCSTVDKLQ